MLLHSYVPSSFRYGIVKPMLKNKHGDNTSIDMYRGITLTPVISKLFEAILLVMRTHSIATLCNLVLKRIPVAVMSCWALQRQSSITLNVVVRYFVPFWMQVRHLIKFYWMVFWLNWLTEMYHCLLFVFYTTGSVGFPVQLCGIHSLAVLFALGGGFFFTIRGRSQSAGAHRPDSTGPVASNSQPSLLLLLWQRHLQAIICGSRASRRTTLSLVADLLARLQ